MTTPAGSPLWVRSADHTSYGGHTAKRNYQSQRCINPLTDVGAEHITRIAADLAAIGKTVPFCVLTFLARDTTPADPMVESCQMLPSGIASGSYVGSSPPSGFPSVVRNADGDHTITFASSYSDAYSVAGGFGVRAAKASPHGATAFSTTVEFTAGGQTVRVYSKTTVAYQNGRVTVTVW